MLLMIFSSHHIPNASNLLQRSWLHRHILLKHNCYYSIFGCSIGVIGHGGFSLSGQFSYLQLTWFSAPFGLDVHMRWHSSATPMLFLILWWLENSERGQGVAPISGSNRGFVSIRRGRSWFWRVWRRLGGFNFEAFWRKLFLGIRISPLILPCAV